MISRQLIQLLESQLTHQAKQRELIEGMLARLGRIEAAVTSTLADIERDLYGQTIALVMHTRLESSESEVEDAIEAFDRLCCRPPLPRRRS